MTDLTVPKGDELASRPSDQDRAAHLHDQWRRCARDWLQAIHDKSGSDRSREEYARTIGGFFAHCGLEDHPGDVQRSHVTAWLADMGDVANATHNQRLAVVSSFYAYATNWLYLDLDDQERPLRDYNPAAGVQRRKVDPYSRSRKVGLPQLVSILGQIERHWELGKRDYALLLTYVYTGRRRQELAAMTWGDIENIDGVPHYRYRGKGGKTGTRELPQPAYDAIVDYLTASGRLDEMTKDSPLWTSTRRAHRGQPMTSHAINNRLKVYAEMAAKEQPDLGIDPDEVSVHGLRHAAAMLRERAGASTKELQAFLDHRHISTTQIYMESLKPRKDEHWRDVQAILSSSPGAGDLVEAL